MVSFPESTLSEIKISFVTTGLLVFAIIWKGRPAPHLRHALLFSGLLFRRRHRYLLPINYTDVVRLAPAVAGGLLLFTAGMVLSHPRHHEVRGLTKG